MADPAMSVAAAGTDAASVRACTPRILFFGQFGCGNLGNEGSLAAMLDALRARMPAARFAALGVDPGAVAREHRIEAIAIGGGRPASALASGLDRLLLGVPHRLGNWVHALRQLRRFDLMIIPGTGILDDFSTGPWGVPYSLWRWSVCARLTGTGIAMVSIGAGPIVHPLSRVFMKAAARLAAYRSFRDRQSRDYMLGIGFDAAQDPVCPDLAFGQAAPPPADPRPSSGRLIVVLGVMTYLGWANRETQGSGIYGRYIATLARFVDWLLAQGHDVRLVTGETADERAVGDLLVAIGGGAVPAPGGSVSWTPVHDLAEVSGRMRDADIVVATRFHNVICALRVGVPVLALGYAGKHDALLGEMGLGAFQQHVEKIDLDRLKAQFTELAGRRETLRGAIRSKVAQYRAELTAQEETLSARFFPDAR